MQRRRDPILAPAGKVTAAQLLARGVVDVGRVDDTSTLFVRTREDACDDGPMPPRLHLFHVDALPMRRVDAWGVERAIALIGDGGSGIDRYAKAIGVNQAELRAAMTAAGVPAQRVRKPGSRSHRKTHGLGHGIRLRGAGDKT